MIEDPEVQLLASIANTLRPTYVDAESAWEGSPFAWIRTRPSRQVGTIGEALVAGWCAAHNFNVLRCPDSNADRIIENARIEIKFSTLWASGFYKFQQLRDQNYDYAVCLGVSPLDAHCWVLPKPVIIDNWGKVAGLSSQHGGRAGRDTAWLQVSPNLVPEWLKPYGGKLGDALAVLASFLTA